MSFDGATMSDFTMALTDLAGLAGVILYLLAYSLLQGGQLRVDEYTYSAMNLLAAAMVLVSLTSDFNLASVLIQISWIFVSLAGLRRLRSSRQRARRRNASRRRSRRRVHRVALYSRG